ncbi:MULTISPECIES: methyltransferase domain-containing protein [unclassified Thiocapsa]|uniref:methyltransferase domain-containing protein n=1 Tax=unclassified Thiocapsa TaxID=2641286 RepID=UPI0035ADA52C
MNLFATIRRRGLFGTLTYSASWVRRHSGWDVRRARNAPRYHNPTTEELAAVEDALQAFGVTVEDYRVDPESFARFKAEKPFPEDYHGGQTGGVWDEKLLEHFIAARLLGLDDYGTDDMYVDVAACHSPWARYLREVRGLNAWAIDLAVGQKFRNLPYYRSENATTTTFADASVRGASLHCAFEMFAGDDDIEFMREAARILAPGGKVVVVPLYLHTHYCSYSTSEYVRMDTWGVPSSRKYDAQALVRRVLDPAIEAGLSYRLRALRNKEELGMNVYCHFILELSR